MNKKTLLIIGVIIVLAVAYWLLSPLWKNVALNEELPISDNLQTMDEATKADFEKQTLEMKDKIMDKNDAMPANKPSIIARAQMVARAHDVEGSALLVKSGNETFLRFESLKTINGPDLRIYLSSGLNADDIVDLGPIRATQGNVNYEIPTGTDLNKYKNAMIWCR